MARVLVVDDQTIIRKKLIKILEECGHEIIGEARNGRQAILMFKTHKPDLVTMDITMPDMDGIEALKVILDYDKESKVIIVSAMNQKSFVFEALKIGAKHFITKPYEKETVIKIVDQVLCMK